ncbi:MAG: superoxide dismutase family protein [Wenzhouxiangellaceae bacterium]|nr:superoxide dismutase family protein [Wenzhouxiangellaceae bacterium]
MNQHRISRHLSMGLCAGFLAFAGMAAASADEDRNVSVGMATIEGCSDKAVIGTALLQEVPSAEGIRQVEVYMLVRGLSDGEHAVHIHETAECEPCTAAGGHHDPGPHGKSTPDAPDFNHPFHMGDLVNLNVTEGVGVMRTITNRVTLSPGRLSIFDDDGSAFIIHTEKDTYCDHEDELEGGCAGGARDACGIIHAIR